MITKEEVINLITKKIPNSEVFVENLKGNDHLQVTVIASEFNGPIISQTTPVSLFCIKARTSFRSYPCTGVKNRNPKLNYGQLNKR
tara:strand:+ start:496 stop:753 length:258 start_codon:yes stop_codon:yes gene_type:complete